MAHGFYSVACPLAESIVRATVTAAFSVQPNIAPGLLKLQYSDCFVEGCDGSVLISGPNTENTAAANVNLRGFEVIEDIKRQIELVCPGVVSCADILASATRDSVVLVSIYIRTI
uniref:peroxidase n=1 Tax=Noccaea caerulescens TaxID=107243 RepID=A0A1J3IN49_NOCCA